jgi:hypothetical protein
MVVLGRRNKTGSGGSREEKQIKTLAGVKRDGPARSPSLSRILGMIFFRAPAHVICLLGRLRKWTLLFVRGNFFFAGECFGSPML